MFPFRVSAASCYIVLLQCHCYTKLHKDIVWFAMFEKKVEI